MRGAALIGLALALGCSTPPTTAPALESSKAAAGAATVVYAWVPLVPVTVKKDSVMAVRVDATGVWRCLMRAGCEHFGFDGASTGRVDVPCTGEPAISPSGTMFVDACGTPPAQELVIVQLPAGTS